MWFESFLAEYRRSVLSDKLNPCCKTQNCSFSLKSSQLILIWHFQHLHTTTRWNSQQPSNGSQYVKARYILSDTWSLSFREDGRESRRVSPQVLSSWLRLKLNLSRLFGRWRGRAPKSLQQGTCSHDGCYATFTQFILYFWNKFWFLTDTKFSK